MFNLFKSIAELLKIFFSKKQDFQYCELAQGLCEAKNCDSCCVESDNG